MTYKRVADALSRRNEGVAHISAMSTLEPTWMDQVILSYEHDPIALQLVTELITTPTNNMGDFTLHPGIIRYEMKIYIGK